MTVSARIQSLKKRHRQLDEEVAEMQRRPGECSTTIYALKREKLALRDEMRRLENS